MAKRKGVLIGAAVWFPAMPDKEDAINIARLNRAGKAAAELSDDGVMMDGSNLADVADAVEHLLSLVRRARASAHNHGDDQT